MKRSFWSTCSRPCGGFEAMWWGSKRTGYTEAGQLADAYVNGSSSVVSIPAEVYEGSAVVQAAEVLMRATIAEHFTRRTGGLTIKSTDRTVRDRIAARRKARRFDQFSQGEIYANGVLKAEETNRRLVFTDNRFILQATATTSGASSSKSIVIAWKVESKYDFEPYSSRPWDITKLPIVYPAARNRSAEDTQRILSQVFPEYMKVNGRYPNGLLLPDGLSNYMVSQGIARPFTYVATWHERLTLAPAKTN